MLEQKRFDTIPNFERSTMEQLKAILEQAFQKSLNHGINIISALLVKENTLKKINSDFM